MNTTSFNGWRCFEIFTW